MRSTRRAYILLDHDFIYSLGSSLALGWCMDMEAVLWYKKDFRAYRC